MVFAFYLNIYLYEGHCIDKSEVFVVDGIKTNEAGSLMHDNSVQINFDDMHISEIPKMNIEYYHKVVKDYFFSIIECPDIKNKIEDILPKKNNDRNKLFLIFKHFLWQYHMGKLDNLKYSEDCSFIQSLAYNSYKIVNRLAINHINDYNYIKKQIFMTIELKFDKNLKSKVIQLFNPKKYSTIKTMLDALNNKENVSRRKRYALPRVTTTVNPFIPDDVKIVYIGKERGEWSGPSYSYRQF
ncbi:uncharacterized protein VNE69_02153 [Vairimorpha necatrix]|uniref:Uncharacterized protein n=1 Tax=Vairimorpha necatrix TaxID=6039 RepID=A0AAX4J9J4_9MICR